MLKILQQNSRLTVKELAAKVNLSPTPAFERQKRLERDGYIQRYAAIVDHHKLDIDWFSIIRLVLIGTLPTKLLFPVTLFVLIMFFHV